AGNPLRRHRRDDRGELLALARRRGAPTAGALARGRALPSQTPSAPAPTPKAAAAATSRRPFVPSATDARLGRDRGALGAIALALRRLVALDDAHQHGGDVVFPAVLVGERRE